MTEEVPPSAKPFPAGNVDTAQAHAATPESTSSNAAEGERERKAITGRAGIVALGTLASRVLGLGREQVLAAMFSRAATDVFLFAFVIPNLLRQLLAEGAMQNAVTPVLAATRRAQGDQAAREFFRHLQGFSLCVLTVTTLLGMIFAPELVTLVASGYSSQPAQFERTVLLTRWLFPYLFFIGSASLTTSALNTAGRYVATSFAPALFNVAFIVCAFLLPGTALMAGADPLIPLAIGVLLGGALQVVVLWPSLRAIGFLQFPGFRFRQPEVREVLRRMGPVLFGVGIYYIDVVVARRLLSHYEVGSLTYFSFAMRLCDFPQGIFVMALQAATLPSLAKLSTLEDKSELIKTFSFGMRLSLFAAMSASALLMVLAEPLVVMIFQYGAFDRAAAVETSYSLVAQAAGVWMVAAVRQLVAVYYALGDTRTPVIVSALDFLLFVALAYSLGPHYGHVGVSIAVSAASGAQMVLLWWGLRRKLGRLDSGVVMVSAARTVGAILPAAGAAWITASALEAELLGNGVLRLLPGLGGAVVFGTVFLGAAWLLKCEELRTIFGPLSRRFAGKR